MSAVVFRAMASAFFLSCPKSSSLKPGFSTFSSVDWC